MSNAEITVIGLVATTPRHLITSEGLAITSFRLTQTIRVWNYGDNAWVSETNWYTITAYSHLAININGSVEKGDRIIVAGNCVVRDWDNGERTGTSVNINANSIGHDLRYGSAKFNRTVLTLTNQPEPEPYEY